VLYLYGMQRLMVYSESGGASKTTTAVGLAMAAATMGKRVTLIDLDPRAASTKWLDVEPREEGLHVGAILGNEDVEGWAEGMAVQTRWHENLRMIPSARSVSTMEGLREDHSELRLSLALQGLEADVVVIDCPNRQGGPLILSALNAADTVVYAAMPNEDGIDGITGARKSVQRFLASRRAMGAPADLVEAGIILGSVDTTAVVSRIELASIQEIEDMGILLTPYVPQRVIVKENRRIHEWFGTYRKGQPVSDAYAELAKKVIR